MTYKLAIFDLDGTVLDTLEDLADSVNHALEENRLPTRSIDEVRRFIGNGARLLIERSVPHGTEPELTDRVFEEYRTYYNTHSDIKTKPYDGIIEMLTRLREKGIRLAVLSNKPDPAVQVLCKQYFPGLFDSVAGEKSGIPRKPSPDAVNAILDEFSLPHTDAVYIGDSDVDVETAKNAGIDCISVTWGFRDEALLLSAGAKCAVHSAAELEAVICK